MVESIPQAVQCRTGSGEGGRQLMQFYFGAKKNTMKQEKKHNVLTYELFSDYKNT
jgi:hypothetical protein